MYCVILCGGSGTRLWPLSRKNYPKQFLRLYSDKSLLQETFLRNSGVIPKDNIFFVTTEESYFNVLNQIKEVYPKLKTDRVIVEPASRSTAPAVAMAVKYLRDKIGIGENEPIIEVHSDHYIGKREIYLNVVKKALKNVRSNIGAIGIVPTKADTGLGYIKKGKKQKNYFEASEFKEKPNLKTAQQYVKSGNYLWNAGMFIFNARTFSEELQKYAPEIYAYFSKSYEIFYKNFKKLPDVSIDIAIAEKTKRMIMFEGYFNWSDIGSFDVLSEIASKNNKISTKHISVDSKNVYTHSDNNRLIATVGIDDINVVESYDAILIQKKGEGEKIKKVVEYLKERKSPEVDHNLIVYRPWGKYEVLIEKPGYKVKKITINPYSRFSLQAHKKRAEHWVVVKGEAKVARGDKTINLKESESTFIPIGMKHRLENLGKENLEIIEVQSGKYLEEDDIIHYEDDYNRK